MNGEVDLRCLSRVKPVRYGILYSDV